MSLENSSSFDHKTECNCSRLALALEVISREVGCKNNRLEHVNREMYRGYESIVKKLSDEKKDNAELRLRLAMQSVIIKEYKDHRERFAPAYSMVEGLYKYIAILEDFIHVNTVPDKTKKRKLE